jgi:hypothetical protein
MQGLRIHAFDSKVDFIRGLDVPQYTNTRIISAFPSLDLKTACKATSASDKSAITTLLLLSHTIHGL